MRGLASKTKELIRYARQLLEADHPQTLRQLHYAIFSRREITYENCQADYRRLGRAMSYARRLYRAWELEYVDGAALAIAQPYAIPGRWIVDESRQPEIVNVFQNASEYVGVVKRAYRRDAWQDQPAYCEVWSEKGTVLGAIRPVADEYGTTLRVCHGFGSTGMEGQIGEMFAGLKKPITVFFLGDHDPSGRAIEQDIHRRAQIASGVEFSIQRLAIHADDIKTFNLPPQRIKPTDTRAASFRRRFGAKAPTVELDALPAAELRRRVRKAIGKLIDRELWDRQVAVQQVELECIAAFAERMQNLPQLNPEASA